jgi:hypothetical protein
MQKLEQRNSMVCPHCDKPMSLMYLSNDGELLLICEYGCKAEYGVTIALGSTTELPICGAKRVQTFGQ